jgi:hypothetical protein
MPKKSSTIECDLPRYLTDAKKWRRAILDNAREAADRLPAGWDVDGPFEIVVLLYLTKGKQFQKNDVDNRLKDVLDGLQGAFSAKVKKIDPRWFPPPDRSCPLCCARRFQSVVRNVGRRACVPTLTTRRPLPVSVLRSPSSMKKYTPRGGQPMRPWQSASSRLPAALRLRGAAECQAERQQKREEGDEGAWHHDCSPLFRVFGDSCGSKRGVGGAGTRSGSGSERG